MTAIRLFPRAVEKPWGRCDLPLGFSGTGPGARVGEIWFEDPRGRTGAPLLVKYLFTSEKLSVQVHPDDELARSQGLAGGKDEAWLVLEAEPSATIGLGLRKRFARDELRAAALDGTIEQLLDWRPAQAGDFHYLPAGTVHAIGPGLKMIEIQQNADVTYRLYDYGRPRDLHVELAVTAAKPTRHERLYEPRARGNGRSILIQGARFVVERWQGAGSARLAARVDEPAWLIPLAGSAEVDGEAMKPGTAWLIEGHAELLLGEDGDLLLAYPGVAARAAAGENRIIYRPGTARAA